MSFFDIAKNIAKGIAQEALNTATQTDTFKNKLYGDKTINQWNQKWINIGMPKNANLTPYNHCVGLYRHVINEKTMYIGRAIELNNGGFRKRLSDYRRLSDSARKRESGRTINGHLDEIQTRVLIVDDDHEAVEIAKQLEGPFIKMYRPEWNKVINI